MPRAKLSKASDGSEALLEWVGALYTLGILSGPSTSRRRFQGLGLPGLTVEARGGGSTNGRLTDGVIRVGGNFATTGSHNENFAASGWPARA